jgi:hypothetical protein
MTSHRYPSLLVAALAATFIGAAAAQTQSEDSSRLPAKKGTTQTEQTQPSAQQTGKMKDQNEQMAQNQSGQMGNASPNSPMNSPDRSNQAKDKGAMPDHNAMSDEHAMSGKTSKSEKHAAEAGGHHQAMNSGHRHNDKSNEAAGSEDKAYREALRDCVKQQDQSQRDSCLDGAIERFHRNV